MTQEKALKVIIIEDSEPDAILLVRELQQHGYQVQHQRVKNARALSDALDGEHWDLILSDYSLPNFSGLRALEMVKERGLDIPFLMMSGLINEEKAVEVLNAGALDFFQKGKFARLIPAIERELREADKRRKHSEVERQLQRSEERFIKAFLANPLAIMICTLDDGMFVDVNPRFLDLLGYAREQVIGRTVDELHLWVTPGVFELLRKEGKLQDIETQLCTRDNQRRDVMVSVEPIDLHGEPCLLAMIVDITERKRIELAEREQRGLAEALRDTALALSSTLELSEVLDQILDNLERVIDYDAAHVILRDNDTLRVARSRGTFTIEDSDHALSALPVLRQLFETRRPIVIPDTQEFEQWRAHFGGTAMRSYIGVPIQLRGEILGVLKLYSRTPSFFAQQHVERLEVFGRQAAIALQNAQLYQRAQDLAAMQERQRLSHDLHDAVSQMLFTSSIIAESLPGLAARAPDKLWPQLEQIRRLNRGALAEMRKLLLELRSESIGEMEIDQLLQQLAQAVMGHTMLDVSIELVIDQALSGSLKQTLYRITQEALNNITKHAHATRVSIVLVARGGRGRLSIKDDGQGFEVRNSKTPGHMGLSIMQKRAEAVGASFTLESAPTRGTEIIVTWEIP